MNSFRLFVFLLLLGLASLSPARAQCLNPLPGNCDQPFEAFDVQTNLPVQSFCVGRPVRIVITCPGRAGVDRNALYYQFVPGARTSAPCTGYTSRTATFTPTQAGPVTVAENAQAGAGTGTIFLRVYEVFATNKPTFQVEACAPGFVRVNVTDQAYDAYTIRIDDGPVQPVSKGAGPQVYAVANTTGKIVVTGFYAVGGLCVGADSTTYSTLPVAPTPVIRRLTLAGSTLQFQLDALPTGYRYELQQADAGSPGGYRTLPQAVFTGTGATLSAAAGPECYRVAIRDVCATVALPVSPPVCSLFLTASSTNGQNTLTFPGTGATYQLRRNGQTLATLPAGTTAYTDAAVTCGVQYCYQLEAVSGPAAARTTIVSNEACVTTTPSPVLPVPQLVASFTPANQVELTATVPGLPTGGRVRYLRSAASGAPTEIGLTARRSLRDSTQRFNSEAGACYQAQFVDDCGNSSALSPAFCPVLLIAKAADLEGNSVQLSWTELRGPDPTVQYSVQLVDAKGAVLSQPAANATGQSYLDQAPPTDRQVLRYRIAATSPGLSQPSYSNIAVVAREMKAVLPTAFTPNDDGLNDVLEVKGRFLSTFTFTVVDRNGQQVFRGTDRTQVWNGRVGNEQPVPGAYVWRFEATDETGKRVVQHGTITLLR
ncbi:T9SS type B sorting domain-containing protein [Hymenobacter cellulosivorans]|uniref:Gliding motility-associated C-terminal domain-containing protein n=1 Tax=Hymenobacter cellulosivorans TaxID=2932249 RepID=A0ABY4F588_9BACT|nr:gliding motility-associated C-terminal domain-containing protein [Hymenobacter cellulosivorans]UOQ51213.1 gliding motility-associated C-terminal domain-containing protein [Hymenobacter cellulosivorans]